MSSPDVTSIVGGLNDLEAKLRASGAEGKREEGSGIMLQ
jgi:hypothetical protein